MTIQKILPCIALCWAMGNAAAGQIQLQSPVPYAENSIIAEKVRNECRIGYQLAEFTRDFSAKLGVSVTLSSEAPDPSTGRVLTLEIVDAFSAGNAFIGHRKYTIVRGVLFENGERRAGFVGRRDSAGGFGAGYKGSCSVLGRTVKALGKDIATWLTNPRDGAQLGDLS